MVKRRMYLISNLWKLMSTMQKIKFMTKYNKDYRYHIKFHSIWNLGIDINQCIDATMHLLFQGINKTLTRHWLNTHLMFLFNINTQNNSRILSKVYWNKSNHLIAVFIITEISWMSLMWSMISTYHIHCILLYWTLTNFTISAQN